MAKKQITFYEVVQDAPYDLYKRSLSDLEIEVFDYINDKGAASVKSIEREFYVKHSIQHVDDALNRLRAMHLLERRNVIVEDDE